MFRQAPTRFFLVGLVGVSLATMAGCGWPPLPPTPVPPAPVLAGDWGTTTADGLCVVITFDEDGYLVMMSAQNDEGITADLAITNSTTTLDGSNVTVVIPAGAVTSTFVGTLSADENTLDGTFSSEIIVDEDLTITIPSGDMTFVRGVECDEGAEKSLHEKIFTEILDDPNYQGTQSCLGCHTDHALDVMESGHWNWSGMTTDIEGEEGEIHGKIDLLNDY